MNNAKTLLKLIKKFDSIIIAKHISPDWDAQGSALGLKIIIEDNFKNKKVYIVGESIDENIVFDELNEDIVKNSLLITVDVANKERIDFDKIDFIKEIFKIDHHINVDKFAKNNEMVYHEIIACTQIIFEWASKCKLKISKQAAYFLYKGLITDSGRFLYDRTNDKTFLVAASLYKKGININEIYNDLYLQKLNTVKFKWNTFLNAKYAFDNQISYIIIMSKDIPEEMKGEKAKIVLNAMASIIEVKIWFLVIEDLKNSCFKISIRSREYDVNLIATKFGGGGHKFASGCKISDLKELDLFLNELKKIL